MADQPSMRIDSVVLPPDVQPTYANFAAVNHTPWDFRVTFAQLQVPHERGTGEVVLTPRAVVDLVLPAGAVHGLIMALKENYDAYLAAYGPPALQGGADEPPG